MTQTDRAVLLVDDEIDICDFLSEYLQDRKIKSFYATEIDEALTIAKENPISIVFLDNNLLNEVSGVDYIPQFKEINPTCKVYMLTANATAEIKSRAIEYGADGYIIKPFDFESFDAAIQEL